MVGFTTDQINSIVTIAHISRPRSINYLMRLVHDRYSIVHELKTIVHDFHKINSKTSTQSSRHVLDPCTIYTRPA